MYKFEFAPRILVEGETRTRARNKLLGILAKAELDGKIYHFNVNHEESA